MGRLIDADALLQEIEESANAVEVQIHLGKCDKNVAKGMLSGLALVREIILRKPTAYDPEKVVNRTFDESIKTKNLAYKEAIEIVKQLAEEYINCSTDTSTNTSIGWIPTSERLPEKNAIVLTCDKDGWISVKVNMPYAGVKNDFECGYYTAWMPLPEPFTPKEGRE